MRARGTPAVMAASRSMRSPVLSGTPETRYVPSAWRNSDAARSRAMLTPLRPGLVPGAADGAGQQLQHLFRLADLRGEPALVPEPGGQLALGELPAQGRVHLGAGPDRLGHGRGAQRRDHELLEVELVGRVDAAVEHVEVRHRQGRGDPVRRQPLPQRHARRRGQRPCQRHGHAHQRVRAEPALVRGAVEIDHGLIRLGQPGPRPALQQVGQLGVHRADRTEHTLAPVPGRVTVAAFHGLPRPGRRARRYPRPGDRPVTEPHRHGQRGPPARVQDLQRRQLCDVKTRHRLLLTCRSDVVPRAWPTAAGPRPGTSAVSTLAAGTARHQGQRPPIRGGPSSAAGPSSGPGPLPAPWPPSGPWSPPASTPSTPRS